MHHALLRVIACAVMLVASFLTARSAASAETWWKPTPGLSWHIQYSGQIDLSLDVAVYNLDLFETSAETIAALHEGGRRVICYFSAGSYEDWRPDIDRFPTSASGEPLADWEGESWIDIRDSQIKMIMQSRLDLAEEKGCDGVDPDNVDGYIQDSGFALTGAD